MEKAINVYYDKSSVELDRSFVTMGLHDEKIIFMFIVRTSILKAYNSITRSAMQIGFV